MNQVGFLVDLNTLEPVAVIVTPTRRTGVVSVSERVVPRRIATSLSDKKYIDVLDRPWRCRVSYAKKWDFLTLELPIANEISPGEYHIITPEHT